MNKYCLLLFAVVLFQNCTNVGKAAKKYEEELASQRDVNRKKIWWTESDSTCDWRIPLKKRSLVEAYKDSIDALVEAINSQSTVRVAVEKTGNDTIYIKVINSEMLTQRMGTRGAKEFIGAVTYTLTGGKYHYVFWNFEEGDNASPGIQSRTSINGDTEFCIDEE